MELILMGSRRPKIFAGKFKPNILFGFDFHMAWLAVYIRRKCLPLIQYRMFCFTLFIDFTIYIAGCDVFIGSSFRGHIEQLVDEQ